MKIQKLFLFTILLVVVVTLNACAEAIPEAGTSPHFAYKGKQGPEHWSELDPSFAICSDGKSQSPIDLTGAGRQDVTNIVFDYKPTKIHIINNGHSVQVNYDPGSYIEVDDKNYQLLQFHFHAPSEHEVDGKLFPAEMHLVHQNEVGQLAVVGVLLDTGAENAAFNPVWNNLPARKGTEKEVEEQVNAKDFLPLIQTTYRYSGSLTTPPCTEGVNWYVMTTPVELSEQQITAFKQIYYGNNRLVQLLYSRGLVIDSTP